MFKSVGRAWRKLAVLAVTAASVCGAAPTLAQQQDTTVTNPVRRIMDPLGIDIASAQFVRSNTHLTIGDPANGGLAWKYIPGAYAYEGLVEYNGTSYNPTTFPANRPHWVRG
jgi:hypothetical protein